MIPPALTAEEWAADICPTIHRGRLKAEGESEHRLAMSIGLCQRPDSPAVLGIALDVEQKAALAALCLHGRITWGMVDALRVAADGYQRRVRASGENADWAGFTHLRALADLIESLVPPREPLKLNWEIWNGPLVPPREP